MVIICAWCQAVLRRIDPPEERAESYAICSECYERALRGQAPALMSPAPAEPRRVPLPAALRWDNAPAAD